VRAVDVAGQGDILLDLVEFGKPDGRDGVFLAVEMASAAFVLGTMKGRSNTLNSGTRPVSGEAEVVTISSGVFLIDIIGQV
jgi:hypothetical protein